MSATLSVGPLAVPWSLLLAFAALAAGWTVAGRIARRRGVDVEMPLYLLLAAGMLAARAAFVAAHADSYAATPWNAFDVRDGGWRPLAGLLGAIAAAALLVAWRRALVRPLAAGLAIAAVMWAAGSFALASLQPAGARLPDLTLVSLENQPVALRGYEGRPVVLNLWASWCPPCRREMPVLQQAQQANPGVQFVFVNQGEEAAKVRAFLAGNHLALGNVLLDRHGQAGVQLGHRALPATLFFDARGRLVDTRVGELSAASLAERLDLLDPDTPPKP